MRAVQGPAPQDLERHLLSSQSADGGWAYFPGRASRIEPTCWSILALERGALASRQAAVRGRQFLQSRQRPDGWVLEPGLSSPNYAWNGLALLTDAARTDEVAALARPRLIDALVSAKGVALEQDGTPGAQNNRLQAWSWVEATFSWIEPTAWCMLALKKAMRPPSAEAAARLAEAEAVVLDRACEGGGWNYGNGQVLGQDLRPYVPTTALAVLAMMDRQSLPAIRAGLAWLGGHATTERAAMALSLATIALHLAGDSTDEVRAALRDGVAATIAFQNRHLIAMAWYALSVREHGAGAFAVA
jgi:hypothetical protein